MENNLFGQTDIGKLRDNNEDAFLAEELQLSRFLLACVIDGVGGYVGGEVAAAIAKETIHRYLAGVHAGEDIIEHLVKAIKMANEAIFKRKDQEPELEKMACVLTLVLADIGNNQFYYAHVGDTRLYLLRDQALVKITQDQSFVGFLEDSGRLTETAAMNHPKRNEINQALGLEKTEMLKDDFIETGQSPFLPDDVLLLCSDGLTDRIEKDKIVSGLLGHTTLKSTAAYLVDAANAAGGQDNITVVLVRNHKARIKHEISKPAFKSEIPVMPLQNTDKPQQINRNIGLLALLSLTTLISLGATGWFYWQLEILKQAIRPIAPVYESPWPPMILKPDTLKKSIKDTVPANTHGKRSAK